MEAEISAAGIFDCVFRYSGSFLPLLLRQNFIILVAPVLVYRAQQVAVYITVVFYEKHIFSFHPLEDKKLKLSNSSFSNEVAKLEKNFYLSDPFSFL